MLADLSADGVADAAAVSVVENAVAERRWWVQQWPQGAEFVAGLIAQDVQEALAEQYGRWPVCTQCARAGEPHALAVAPDLGPDPHWVCEPRGTVLAPVGALPAVR